MEEVEEEVGEGERVRRSESALTYFGPPDITGQTDSVQNSLTVPYIKLIRLKKSTTNKNEKKRRYTQKGSKKEAMRNQSYSHRTVIIKTWACSRLNAVSLKL